MCSEWCAMDRSNNFYIYKQTGGGEEIAREVLWESKREMESHIEEAENKNIWVFKDL